MLVRGKEGNFYHTAKAAKVLVHEGRASDREVSEASRKAFLADAVHHNIGR